MVDRAHVEYFPSFASVPSRGRCIWARPNVAYQLCGHIISGDRLRDLTQQRNNILSQESTDHDAIYELLGKYALGNCCNVLHKQRLNENNLLRDLVERWSKEINHDKVESDSEHHDVKSKRESVHIVAGTSTAVKLTKLEPEYSSRSKECMKRTTMSQSEMLKLKTELVGVGQSTCRKTSCYEEKPSHKELRSNTTCPVKRSGSKVQYSPKCIKESIRVLRSGSKHTRKPQTENVLYDFYPRKANSKQSMLELLKKPLSDTEKKSGSLYIYAIHSNPGYLKIGVTGRSVDVRVREWKTKCGYEPQLIYLAENVPYAGRVESFIHQEFLEYWRKTSLCRCGSEHMEFFEIDEASAKKVMHDWIEWIECASPYHDLGTLKDTWSSHLMKLNDDQKQNLKVKDLLEIQRHALVAQVLKFVSQVNSKKAKSSTCTQVMLRTTKIAPSSDVSSKWRDILQRTFASEVKILPSYQTAHGAFIHSTSAPQVVLA